MITEKKARILISIPSTSHIEIAEDELTGLQDCGYVCESFSYAGRKGVNSKFGRLLVIVGHAFSLIVKAYRFRPDIIYFNSRLEVLGSSRDYITLVLVKTLYFGKVLFVIKSHGSDLEVLSSNNFWLSAIVFPFLKKHIAAWLFLSIDERNAIVHQGYLYPQRIFVTKNIVRVEQFKKDAVFRKQLGIKTDQTILLFTGRMIREKGVYEIIEAFDRLITSYQLVLVMIGDGNEFEALKCWARNKKIIDKVVFTGFIPERDVIPFYANADILVLPTYFPEGFPMSLFNAVAAGMAIVTTQIRAAKDYLVAPDNCLWVKPKDSDNLESAIAMLLESPVLMKNMRNNNLNKGGKFSKAVVCPEISLAINNIMHVRNEQRQ